MFGTAVCAVALVAATALASCGSGSTTTGTLAGGPAGRPGPPPVRETIDEAQARFAETLSSGDCNKINALAPLATGSQLDTEQRCQGLQSVGKLGVSGAASYGDLAGVIDYSAGDHVITAVLVRDSDGLFHLAFTNPFNPSPTVGTPLAKQFNSEVRAGVEALKNKDCEAFLKVANRRLGVGALSQQEACKAVQENIFPRLLAGERKVHLKPLGGNGSYAFYGLDTPSVYFTIVAAKESPHLPASLRSAGVSSLPPGAATYGYVQAYATNRAGAGSD
jgi:hypothetical protein